MQGLAADTEQPRIPFYHRRRAACQFLPRHDGQKVRGAVRGKRSDKPAAAAKKRPSHITAVELQPQLCDMMRRSVALNDLQEVIDVVCEDVKNFRAQADVVVCNPPYRKADSGERQTAHNIAPVPSRNLSYLIDVVGCAGASAEQQGQLLSGAPKLRLAEIVYPLQSKPACRKGNSAGVPFAGQKSQSGAYSCAKNRGAAIAFALSAVCHRRKWTVHAAGKGVVRHTVKGEIWYIL